MTVLNTIQQRFTGGINDVAASDPFAELLMLDPTRYAVFFEDFIQFDFGDYPADSDAVALQYAVTLDTELDYDVSFTGATGALTLTTEGGDTEGGQFRLNGSPFTLTAGKKAWYEVRYNLTATTVAQYSLFLGLASNQTGTNFIDDAGTALAVDDCWGFLSVDAEGGVDAVVRHDDEQSVITDVHAQVTAVNVVLSLYYDGAKTYVYENGIEKGTITGTHPADGTTDTMTAMIHFKSQSAEAGVLNVDYVLAVLER